MKKNFFGGGPPSAHGAVGTIAFWGLLEDLATGGPVTTELIKAISR